MTIHSTEKYTGTFYDLETENGRIKTHLRETPKLEMQEGYVKPYWNRERVADTIADLLIEGYITEEVFTNFINRYPE